MIHEILADKSFHWFRVSFEFALYITISLIGCRLLLKGFNVLDANNKQILTRGTKLMGECIMKELF